MSVQQHCILSAGGQNPINRRRLLGQGTSPKHVNCPSIIAGGCESRYQSQFSNNTQICPLSVGCNEARIYDFARIGL